MALGAINNVGLDTSHKLKKWTDIDGRTVKAIYVKRDESLVTLKLENGKIVNYPLNKLSKENREVISSYSTTTVTNFRVSSPKKNEGKGAYPFDYLVPVSFKIESPEDRINFPYIQVRAILESPNGSRKTVSLSGIPGDFLRSSGTTYTKELEKIEFTSRVTDSKPCKLLCFEARIYTKKYGAKQLIHRHLSISQKSLTELKVPENWFNRNGVHK